MSIRAWSPHQARPEGLRCFCRYVGRGWKVNHTRPPHGAHLFPKRPRQDRRDSGVCAAVWGVGSPNARGPPRGHPYSLNNPGRTRGTRVLPPLCAEGLEGQSYPTTPRGSPIPPNGLGKTGKTRVYLPLCGEELDVQTRVAPP